MQISSLEHDGIYAYRKIEINTCEIALGVLAYQYVLVPVCAEIAKEAPVLVIKLLESLLARL